MTKKSTDTRKKKCAIQKPTLKEWKITARWADNLLYVKDARWKIWIKRQKEINLSVAWALFDQRNKVRLIASV